jgi:hypothetical protein
MMKLEPMKPAPPVTRINGFTLHAKTVWNGHELRRREDRYSMRTQQCRVGYAR